MNPPRYDSAPAGAPRLAIEVASVSKDAPTTALFLGAYKGILTHWQKSRSFPCPGEDACPKATHTGSAIFKAYAPAAIWSASSGRWILSVIELTSNIEETLRGRNLRGEVWVLSREDRKDKTSPVVGLLLETRESELVPRAFDVQSTVCRFYGTQRIAWDIPNPTPPRLFAESIDAPAPLLPPELAPDQSVPQSSEDRARAMKALREARSTGKVPGVRPVQSDTQSTNGIHPRN